MADVPTGAVPAPATPAEPAKPVNPIAVAREKQAAKLAKVTAGLTKLNADAAAADAPAKPAVEKLASEKTPEPKIEKAPEVEAKPVEKVDEPKIETPADEAKADEEHDPKTAKALAAIDKQAKKFREEQSAAKRAFDQEVAEQRAELARMKQQLQSDLASTDELKKQAKRDPIGLLRKLGLESEDDWEIVGRSAFPLTKAGKADPRSAELAARTQKEVGRDSEIAEMRAEIARMREEREAEKKQVETRSFVENWANAAVKAIPADKPTLIARLHAKAPDKARGALVQIGAELEKANGETPDHADVIAEFEKRERAELEDRGVDVDALLRPASAAPAAKAPSKTLDLEAPKGGTRPINGHPTRAERLASISAGLSKLNADA